ncbi:MAG: hypothetical protein RLZZ41_3 [Actinomycetota bacterium]
MSQTPRPLSPAVYRRRRIGALIALAIIVSLIWGGVNAVGLWTAGAPGPEEVTLPEGVNESSVVVEAGQPCPPGTVSVMAQVGDSAGVLMNRFGSDETPHIWFTITNTNSVDCTFNVGAKVQYFTIKSGDQQIWTSRQCSREGLTDNEILLTAGQTISSPAAPWEKVFSSPTGCGVDQAPVVTGGASYHVEAEVNGELSSNDQQFVLD